MQWLRSAKSSLQKVNQPNTATSNMSIYDIELKAID